MKHLSFKTMEDQIPALGLVLWKSNLVKFRKPCFGAIESGYRTT